MPSSRQEYHSFQTPAIMDAFPFTHLPVELQLDIIEAAAFPQFDGPPTSVRSCYTTAVALCSVSHCIRRATMPHLLHTVVLSSGTNVVSFINSIMRQRHFQNACPKLAVDYTKLVRRFWSTESCEPVSESEPDEYLDYGALYEIIRNVQSLGVGVLSQHLLYHGLASLSAKPDEDWNCRRLTFAGTFWRWMPITSTPDGLACLRRVTHLVLLIGDRSTSGSDDDRAIPTWLKHVPFNFMPALTHFAFGTTAHSHSEPDPETCRRWIVDENPGYRDIVKDMVIRPILMEPSERVWELAFLRGKNDEIW